MQYENKREMKRFCCHVYCEYSKETNGEKVLFGISQKATKHKNVQHASRRTLIILNVFDNAVIECFKTEILIASIPLYSNLFAFYVYIKCEIYKNNKKTKKTYKTYFKFLISRSSALN